MIFPLFIVLLRYDCWFLSELTQKLFFKKRHMGPSMVICFGVDALSFKIIHQLEENDVYGIIRSKFLNGEHNDLVL